MHRVIGRHLKRKYARRFRIRRVGVSISRRFSRETGERI